MFYTVTAAILVTAWAFFRLIAGEHNRRRLAIIATIQAEEEAAKNQDE